MRIGASKFAKQTLSGFIVDSFRLLLARIISKVHAFEIDLNCYNPFSRVFSKVDAFKAGCFIQSQVSLIGALLTLGCDAEVVATIIESIAISMVNFGTRLASNCAVHVIPFGFWAWPSSNGVKASTDSLRAPAKLKNKRGVPSVDLREFLLAQRDFDVVGLHGLAVYSVQACGSAVNFQAAEGMN